MTPSRSPGTSGPPARSRIPPILFLALLAAGTLAARAALAQFGLDEAAGAANLTQQEPAVFIGTIIRVLLGFVGLLFFLLMLYAGFKWMTARGAPDEVKKAKELIVSAIIGVAIISAAYAITSLVINKIANPDDTTEKAGNPPAPPNP